MVGEKPAEPITGKIAFPDMAIVAAKTVEELKNLHFTKIKSFFD